MSVTRDDVLAVLRTIQDPDLHKDIVTLGFVKDVKLQDGEVDFTIEAVERTVKRLRAMAPMRGTSSPVSS